MTARSNFRWTVDEVATLTRMRLIDGATHAAIGVALDRSWLGVRNKLNGLGLSRRGILGRPRRYPDDRGAAALAMRDGRGLSYKAIGKELGVSKEIVSSLIWNARRRRQRLRNAEC